MGIAIERVLKNFDDTLDERSMEVKEFGVKLITSDGRLRTMRAHKLVKAPKQQLSQPLSVRGGISYNLKRNGVMMLEDLDRQEPRSTKPSMFFAFKDFQSSTWQNVFH